MVSIYQTDHVVDFNTELVLSIAPTFAEKVWYIVLGASNFYIYFIWYILFNKNTILIWHIYLSMSGYWLWIRPQSSSLVALPSLIQFYSLVRDSDKGNLIDASFLLFSRQAFNVCIVLILGTWCMCDTHIVHYHNFIYMSPSGYWISGEICSSVHDIINYFGDKLVFRNRW